MSRAIYFSDQELTGMVDEVVARLDRARGFFGFAIVLTCGYRSPEKNAEVGGVADSAHCKGMAADIQAPADPQMRERLMWALGAAGFTRVESAPKHFHVDIDLTKPNPAWWIGDDH